MFCFRKKYFILFLLLLLLEIFIGFFIHDDFIRPHVGDYLVVMLLYCFLRSFIFQSPLTIAFLVLLFSYAVELAQYFSMAKKLGLPSGGLATIIVGNSFDWGDIAAYTIGVVTILFLERNNPLLSKK